MEKSRSRVHHGAHPQVRRDTLLHPRSGRLYYRSRTEHRPDLRLAVRLTLGPKGMRIQALAEFGFAQPFERTSPERRPSCATLGRTAQHGTFLSDPERTVQKDL